MRAFFRRVTAAPRNGITTTLGDSQFPQVGNLWAEDRQAYAIGIVLSGGGSDGTLGIKAIKEHGGLTLAQAPDGSGPRHASMPESAIASGLVDLAVPVEAMPKHLGAYVRSFGVLDEAKANEPQAETARKAICAILLNQTGHDFSGYKTRTFYRRIERRM